MESDPADGTATLSAQWVVVTDPTAALRRMSFVCVENNVAYRNIIFAENGGNVGIGTSTPAVKLDVVGALSATGTATFTSGAFGVIGTTLFTSGAFGVVGTATFSVGVVNFNSGVLATSPTTGAVRVVGGVGVTDQLFILNGFHAFWGSLGFSASNACTLGTVDKATSPTGDAGTLLIYSNDAVNRLQGNIALITDPTAGNRRLDFYCLEQNVAFRNITLAVSGGNVGIGTSTPATKLEVVGTLTASGTAFFGGYVFGNRFDATHTGLVSPSGGGATLFLNADGSFSVPAGGGVGSAGASTDNAVARWSGVTGALIKNTTTLLIDDTGNVTSTGTFSVNGSATFTSGAFNVNGTTNFTSGAWNATATAFNVNGTTTFTAARFGVIGTALFTANLFSVVGTSQFTGVTGIAGTTNITGFLTNVGTAQFTGGSFLVSATSNITGIFSVVGTTLFTSGTFGIVGTTLVTGIVGIVGSSILTGTLTVSGTTVLTSVGTGVLIANAGIVTSAGGMVLLATLSPNNVASTNNTSVFTSAYRTYEITFDNICPATQSTFFQMAVSTTGNAYVSGGYFSLAQVNVSSVIITDTSTTVLLLTGTRLTATMLTSTLQGLSGAIKFYNPAATTYNKHISGLTSYCTATAGGIATTSLAHASVNGQFNSSTAINGVNFSFNSGNIITGTIKIYGMT